MVVGQKYDVNFHPKTYMMVDGSKATFCRMPPRKTQEIMMYFLSELDVLFVLLPLGLI